MFQWSGTSFLGLFEMLNVWTPGILVFGDACLAMKLGVPCLGYKSSTSILGGKKKRCLEICESLLMVESICPACCLS